MSLGYTTTEPLPSEDFIQTIRPFSVSPYAKTPTATRSDKNVVVHGPYMSIKFLADPAFLIKRRGWVKRYLLQNKEARAIVLHIPKLHNFRFGCMDPTVAAAVEFIELSKTVDGPPIYFENMPWHDPWELRMFCLALDSVYRDTPEVWGLVFDTCHAFVASDSKECIFEDFTLVCKWTKLLHWNGAKSKTRDLHTNPYSLEDLIDPDDHELFVEYCQKKKLDRIVETTSSVSYTKQHWSLPTLSSQD